MPTITTPAVAREAQRHFGCTTAQGAPLETEGGEGTSLSHLERRHFDGELMVGNAAMTDRAALSNITLAVLEDSGWFIPDYSAASALEYGRGRGCEFLEGTCGVEADQKPAFEGIFCDNSVQSAQE